MTFTSKRRHALLAAAAILALPGAALAQNDVTDQVETVAEEANDLQQASNDLSAAVAEDQNAATDAAAADATGERDRDDGDDDSGKWGLLGLLGLAGLLGKKRRDDIRVDNRATGTRTDRDGKL